MRSERREPIQRLALRSFRAPAPLHLAVLQARGGTCIARAVAVPAIGRPGVHDDAGGQVRDAHRGLRLRAGRRRDARGTVDADLVGSMAVSPTSSASTPPPPCTQACWMTPAVSSLCGGRRLSSCDGRRRRDPRSRRPVRTRSERISAASAARRSAGTSWQRARENAARAGTRTSAARCGRGQPERAAPLPLLAGGASARLYP